MLEPSKQAPSAGEYRSFLVRLWQSHAEGVWHASAQSVKTGEMLHFTDLSALFFFLRTQTDPASSEEIELPATGCIAN